LDVILSLSGLVALSPLMLAIAIVIRFSMGAPILFRHTRPGRHAKPFQLLKFRSMRPQRDPDGRLLLDNERVTRVGAFLRRTSLDELPELWNILRGDMSLVGPRPLIMEYLPRYSPEQARRHEVRPGLTGLAQVNGRHLLSWERRFELDVWYIDHWSLRLDLRILAATLKIMTQGSATPLVEAEDYEFLGTEAPRP
jgi:lipopolysaccharide/colanic/teichoic acid biosynthesis glycosyltransferase